MAAKRKGRQSRSEAHVAVEPVEVPPAAPMAPADPPADEPARDARFARLACVALVVVVAALYANSMTNGFVFDDFDVVLGDRRVQLYSNIRALLTDTYRPLRTMSYAVDYAVWGFNPIGFRLTNVAVHMANCVLAFFVARKLFGRDGVAALVAALIFAAHPVQVESVAYISGRRDVLFALFYLVAFLCYTRFGAERTLARKAVWLAATAVAFLFSLMSKEMAASFPFVCLLWDLYGAAAPGAAGERPPLRDVAVRLARERGLLVAAIVPVLAAFAYYTLFLRGATMRVAEASVEFWGGSLLNNLLTVPLTYAHYAWLAVLPVRLVVQYYGAFEPASGLADPRVLPALAFLVGLAGTALWLMFRTSWRAAGFGVGWFLLALLPASQIVPHHEIVADHYLYLPVLGVGIAVAAAIPRRADSASPWRRRALVAVAAAVVLLGVRTVVRNTDFRDQLSLWEATYAAVPQSPRASYSLGFEMTKRGNHERAMELYREAIARDPEWVEAYFNLSSTLVGLGRYDEARRVCEDALRIDLPHAARTWHTTPRALEAIFKTQIAKVDAQAGRTDTARDALAELVAANPDLIQAQETFASVLEIRRELDGAIADYRARAAAEPEALAPRLTLANLLWEANRHDEAYELFAEAARAKPDSALANFRLAVYYTEFRPGLAPEPTAAAAHFDAAVRAAITFADAEVVQSARDKARRGR
jgi:tetratricopeptide (TPR) repeat protein